MREFASFIVGTIVGWAMPPLMVHLLYWLVIAAVLGYKAVTCA